MNKTLPLFIALILFGTAYSQTTITTNHTNNNGNGSITFNVYNSNSYDIIVTDLQCHLGTTSTNNCQLLVNTTPVNDNAAPWNGGTVGNGSNGWVLKASATVSSNTSNGIVTALSGMEVLIPAGATYGFGFSSTTLQYQTLSSGAGTNTFTQGGVSIITGDGVSWGGTAYPSTPANYPRGFIGGLTFVPALPCTGTAGPVSSSGNCTTGAIDLSVPSAGTSAVYQWQSSATGTDFTSISAATSKTYNTSVTSDTYFRCYVTCGGATDTTAAYLVKTPKTGYIASSICYGTTLSLNGDTYSSSGTYTQTLTATNGCDSILTIDLTVLNPITATLDTTICAGTSLMIGGTSYNTVGTYTKTLTAANGCDSTITLNLSIIQPTGSTVTESSCSSYILNGQTYTQSGTFTQTLTNSAGCDSIITLNLIINQPTNSTITESSCSSYTLNGQTYSQSGTYTQTLTNTNGCDSIITLNLEIYTIETTSVTQKGASLTANNNSSGVTYQWVNCSTGNNITDATGQTFVAKSNGTYKVVASKGSCSSSSTCYTVDGLGGEANLFPNPSNGEFTIRLGATYPKIQVELYNTFGKLMLRRHEANTNIITINEQLKRGMYHVRIQAGDVIIAKRVMIGK